MRARRRTARASRTRRDSLPPDGRGRIGRGPRRFLHGVRSARHFPHAAEAGGRHCRHHRRAHGACGACCFPDDAALYRRDARPARPAEDAGRRHGCCDVGPVAGFGRGRQRGRDIAFARSRPPRCRETRARRRSRAQQRAARTLAAALGVAGLAPQARHGGPFFVQYGGGR